MANGLLGKAVSVANGNTKVYTVPSDVQFATVSVCLVNRGAANSTARIAICSTDTPTNSEYVEFGVVLEANGGALERTCLILSPGERVIVYADSANLSIRVQGLEQA